jgi:hypothetical protein
MNPDGYVFSFSDDPDGRMWRKTRKPNGGSPSCPGTDLNRNYDDHWSGVDLPGGPQNCASTNPCSNSYQGDTVWSEPESAAVRDFLAIAGPVRLSNELMGGIDLHSFGQMFNREHGLVHFTSLPSFPKHHILPGLLGYWQGRMVGSTQQ